MAVFFGRGAAMVPGGELADQLQRALHARAVIERANRALAARGGLSEREAFERLRRQARRERGPIADAAAEVMAAVHHRYPGDGQRGGRPGGQPAERGRQSKVPSGPSSRFRYSRRVRGAA